MSGRKGCGDALRVGHVLRKCNPDEWGGTETALQRLCDSLRPLDVQSIIFCPRLPAPIQREPFAHAGHGVRRFQAALPIWGISEDQRQRAIAVGGNLLSLHLPLQLLREPGLDVIHAHTGNRLGAAAWRAARLRRVPFVMTIHGGVLDLPDAVRRTLAEPLHGGFEWGRLFGLLLGSRGLIANADLVIAVNRTEAALLARSFPRLAVEVIPHGIPVAQYRRDCRFAALTAFPSLRGRRVVLVPGRIDRPKNQAWVVEQWPALHERHPDARLVLAGSVTDVEYGAQVKRAIRERGLEDSVLLTGGLPHADERLIGLFQLAQMVALPSLTETFGLVLVEAWASGTTVLTTRTSGAREIVTDGEDGLLYDLAEPGSFHRAVDLLLGNDELRARLSSSGQRQAEASYDERVVATRMRGVYERLVETART